MAANKNEIVDMGNSTMDTNAHQALDNIFNARSVAVVGASTNTGKFGGMTLERRDAQEMVREIRGYPLLTGARGQAAPDLEALFDLLLDVSRLVTDRGDIKELDLNPVRLYERGLLVLDARMMIKNKGDL